MGFARAFWIAASCGTAALVSGLATCQTKSHDGLLAPVAASALAAATVDVHVATTRLRSDKAYSFSFGRSHVLNYQHVSVSIPPNHQEGQLEWPRQIPGRADTEFAALSNRAISVEGFEQQVAAKAAAGDGEVTLFVHGFNTTYEQAVLRLAQLSFDAGASGAAVLFAWPSRGRVLDYMTDRESATFSRDRLELVLRGLAQQPEVRRINLLAHSMGAFLAMETLRQAKLRGDGEFSGKLNAVVLAAPDIDLDVFRTQLEVIGKREHPTILLISKDDRALSLARTLTGAVERVGVVHTDSREAQDEIVRLGLTVIDLTAVQISGRDKHDKFAMMPGTLRFIGGLLGDKNATGHGKINIFGPLGRPKE
jgi:esterase/lipase superfamily enzyme